MLLFTPPLLLSGLRKAHNASPKRKPPLRCVLPASLARQAQIVNSLPDSRARYLHLVDLGETLSSLPSFRETATTRVSGCTSLTHVEVITKGDKVVLRGSSDAKVSCGMVAFFVQGLKGCNRDDILGCTEEKLLEACGIKQDDGRLTNLGHILGHIQRSLKGQNEKPSSKNRKREVAVLLSGGVDSSVALRLAVGQGMKVKAFYLKIWLEDEMGHLGECPWEEDLKYARQVCEEVGVELVEVGLQKEYWERVVTYVLKEAKEGRTPNPDVMCNSQIKFGAFLERFGGFEQVVTGHYARKQDGELWISRDEVKDQTYFLGRLTESQLKGVEFPLGDFTKVQVRHMARRFGLATMKRKESQGICFLGKIRFEEFLREKLGEREGQLVEFESGKVVGKHKGYWFFTTGQRKGVGLSGGPWYVVCKQVEENVVYVSRRYESCFGGDWFGFENLHWMGKPRGGPIRVKTRHTPGFCEATVDWEGKVWLGQRDKGLAPGQFCVFYEGERVLGSAVISDTGLLQEAPQICGAAEKRLQAHF